MRAIELRGAYLLFAASLFALCVFAAPRAAAEPAGPQAEPAGYREHIERALLELQHGNHEEARQDFLAAHALAPSARTLRGLGFATFELREYVAAVDYLERALSSSARPLEGHLREETSALLERARGYTGELQLDVAPPDATVRIDGRTLDPGVRVVRLDVGDHPLELSAQGYDGESGVVHIDGGRVRTLRTQLVALPPVLTAPGANPSPSPHDDSKNMRRRRWLWSLAGVMVVAGAAAVTAVLLTDSHPTETRAVPGPNTPSGAAVSTWVGL